MPETIEMMRAASRDRQIGRNPHGSVCTTSPGDSHRSLHTSPLRVCAGIGEVQTSRDTAGALLIVVIATMTMHEAERLKVSEMHVPGHPQYFGREKPPP